MQTALVLTKSVTLCNKNIYTINLMEHFFLKQHSQTHAGIAALLAMAMALGPLALDTYLPAFPNIATSLAVSVHDVSLTISIYIFVLAFGQLCGGPMSDRFGRQKIMLSGLALFSLASFFLAFADSLPEFLFLRGVQAFGGGWATVTIPAIVRDKLSGIEAAKFFSLIGLLMVIAPAIAPTIGSVILTFLAWEPIFVFLGLYALVTLGCLKLVVFKQKDPIIHQHNISIWQRYRKVIATRPAMHFMLIGSLAFSVLMLFITHASYIYQQHFAVSPMVFSALFSANVALMLVMNLTNRKLLNTHSPEKILRWSLTAQAIGIVCLLIATVTQAPLSLFVLAMMVTIGMLGATSPNIQACYMEYFSENGGTAAALMGASQFSVAGIISAASALLPESLLTIILTQGVCSLLCIILVWGKK